MQGEASVCAIGNFGWEATQNQSGEERESGMGVGQPRGGYGSLSEVESINLGITSIEGENIRMKTVALDLQQCLEILL